MPAFGGEPKFKAYGEERGPLKCGQVKSVGKEWTIGNLDRTQATCLPSICQSVLLGD